MDALLTQFLVSNTLLTVVVVLCSCNDKDKTLYYNFCQNIQFYSLWFAYFQLVSSLEQNVVRHRFLNLSKADTFVKYSNTYQYWYYIPKIIQ